MSMLRKEEKTFVDLFLVLSKVVLFSELKSYLLPDNNRGKNFKIQSKKRVIFILLKRQRDKFVADIRRRSFYVMQAN